MNVVVCREFRKPLVIEDVSLAPIGAGQAHAAAGAVLSVGASIDVVTVLIRG